MGGLLCERAGVATICLEGVMITGSWAAATVAYYTHSPWFGICAGILMGAFTMGLHGLLSIFSKADHIISGVCVNLFAAGLTPFLNKILFGGTTHSGALDLSDRFLPFSSLILPELPWLSKILLEHTPLVYMALTTPFLIHFLMYRTSLGLRIQASGDSPEVLRSAGVSPERVRLVALLMGGAIASLGGAFLSISHASQFTRDMTAGRGFIALTAVIFGKWRPLPTLGACVFFGFTHALQIQLQSSSIFGVDFAVQVIQVIPYAATLFVLVSFIGRAHAPLSIGKG
jgi:simple sugar transport system permease protein